jgi:hypothetical protein
MLLAAAAAAQNAAQRSHDLLIKAINFAQKPGAGRVMQVVGLPAADEPKARVRPCFYGLYQITIDLQHLLSFFLRAHILYSHVPQQHKFVIPAIFPSRTPFICIMAGSPNLHALLFTSILIAAIARLCSVETKPKASADEMRICSAAARAAILPCLEIITT